MPGDVKLVDQGVLVTGNLGVNVESPVRTVHAEGSEIHSGGSGGGYSFSDRAKKFVETPTAGERWVWWAQGGTARLWSGTDKITVAATGDVTTTGGMAIKGKLSAATTTIEGALTVRVDQPPTGSGKFQVPGYKATLITASFMVGSGTRVGINTATPEYTLDVVGDARVSGMTVATLKQTSSRALKDDIATLPGEVALRVLKALEPVSFLFKADVTGERQFGFIAEDTPTEVTGPAGDGVNMMNVLTVLTQVVKQQQVTLDAIAAELAGRRAAAG